MGDKNKKPSRCEWCGRLTESSFLHYLGAAKAWICYSCFHGKPYDDFVANDWSDKAKRITCPKCHQSFKA